MISRTIGLLGLLASVMALSSLIYGAFQEPLGPYMQGIMGGVMDVYRTIRDLLFGGLGFVFSSIITWIAQWLTWLPAAPWFRLPGFIMDLIQLYIFFGTSFAYWNIRTLEGVNGKTYVITAGPIAVLKDVVFWPFRALIFIRIAFFNYGKKVGLEGAEKIFRGYLLHSFFQFLRIVSASSFFFLLVYAENQIGL